MMMGNEEAWCKVKERLGTTWMMMMVSEGACWKVKKWIKTWMAMGSDAAW